MTVSTTTVQHSDGGSEAKSVPLGPDGNCLWCGMEPGSRFCCGGEHPDARAAEREARDLEQLPQLVLGAPKGTPQPGLLTGRADIGRRTRRVPRRFIGGAR